MQHVLDGGALLHRVPWSKGMKFNEIAAAYVGFVRRHYGQARIVFDSYEDPMSIKVNEHIRRSSKGSSRNITVIPENNVPYPKDRFLSNNHNKSQLINLLKNAFQAKGHTVKVCKGDADTMIVKDALDCAENDKVVVVADDTDVAIMLLYHWKEEDRRDIFLLQESAGKCWNIRNLSDKIKDIKDHLLFIHAWSGCDSTSAIHGKGKVSFLNLVRKSKNIQSASAIMMNTWAEKSTIGDAAINVFIELYGGRNQSNLRQMRYTKYKQMLSNGVIEPEKLPPSERSAYFHGLRVYLQIMQWLLLDENDDSFVPTDWGWSQAVDYLKPIATDKPVAPPEILHIIRCNCKTTSKNPCGTNICSCKKNGLKCMSSCGDCHGEDCNNKRLTDENQHREDRFDEPNHQEDDDVHRNVFNDIFDEILSKSCLNFM